MDNKVTKWISEWRGLIIHKIALRLGSVLCQSFKTMEKDTRGLVHKFDERAPIVTGTHYKILQQLIYYLQY